MFTIKDYESTLKNLISCDLCFSTEWHNPSKNSVFLRHDIDFSIEDAFKIALLEESINIKSTFFFMLTSNMYNLMSKSSQQLVHKISEMGHKVSIHFDPTAYKNLEPFLDEKNCFEKLFHTEINIVSIHRPGVFLNDNNRDLYGVAHTYQDVYFKDMAYISDSGGQAVDEKIKNYIYGPRMNGLQLLLHPIWWTRKTNSPTDTLNLWRQTRNDFITNEITLNCKTYRS